MLEKVLHEVQYLKRTEMESKKKKIPIVRVVLEDDQTPVWPCGMSLSPELSRTDMYQTRI